MQSLQKGTFSYEITLQIASDDVKEKIGYDESYYPLLEYVRVSIDSDRLTSKLARIASGTVAIATPC